MNLLIAQIMFTLQLCSGTIVSGNDLDGRTLYFIPSVGIEYAYKGEIIQYLETGEFNYDETIDDKVDTSQVKL